MLTVLGRPWARGVPCDQVLSMDCSMTMTARRSRMGYAVVSSKKGTSPFAKKGGGLCLRARIASLTFPAAVRLMSAQSAILARRLEVGMLEGFWMILASIVVFLFFGMFWAGFVVLTSWFLEEENGTPNPKDDPPSRD